MTHTHAIEMIKGALRDSPTFIVVFYNFFIAALPNILLILAFIYAILNISYLLWKWRKEKIEFDRKK